MLYKLSSGIKILSLYVNSKLFFLPHGNSFQGYLLEECVMVLWFGFVIFSVPLVASRHNIHQRRGKILPKNIPWSDLDFKIVLNVIEKRFIKNSVMHL